MTVLHPGQHDGLRRPRTTPARGSRLPAARVPATRAPVGHLVVDASHSVLCPQLARNHLAVTVDDLPFHLRWGRTVIALPPGRHRVEVVVDRGDGWGRVVEAVPVADGHRLDVYYRAPVLPGRPGSLGPVPQPTSGVVGLLGLFLAVLVLLGGLATLGVALFA
jgi:hypothetical protein